VYSVVDAFEAHLIVLLYYH